MLLRSDEDGTGGSLRAGGPESSFTFVSLDPFGCASIPVALRGGNCGTGGAFPLAAGREGKLGAEEPLVLVREGRLGRDGKLGREAVDDDDEGAGALPRMELNFAVRPPDRLPKVDFDSERGAAAGLTS